MKSFLLLLTGFLLILGCESEEDLTTGPQRMKGSVIGYTRYFDTMYSNEGNRPLAGASIFVEGTPFIAISDSTGRWEIHDLPAGTYSMVCSKEGYTKMKVSAFKFVGNGIDVCSFSALGKIPYLIPKDLVLRAFQPYKLPAYKDSIYVYSNGDTLNIKVLVDSIVAPGLKTTFSGAIHQRRFLGNVAAEMSLFFSSDSAINPEDPASYRLMVRGIPYPYSPPDNIHDFHLTTDTLISLGFQSGQEIFCAVYAGSNNTVGLGYFDLKTGKTCWTGYRPEHITKRFIVP